MNVPNLIVGIGSLLAGADALKRAFKDDQPQRRRRQLEDGVQAGDQMTVKTYTVKTISQRVGYIIQMIQKGRDNPTIRQRTVQILSQKCGRGWCVPEKDWPAEVEAVFKAVREHIRYTRDTYGKDLFQHPVRTFQFGGADCLPEGTLLLTDAHQLVPIEKLEAGTRIWGLDDWTEVKAAWSKGVLPVDQVELNNGSSFKATADHKVYVAICPRHPVSRPNSQPCSCPISERSIERIRVAQLEEDMVLLQPEQIPYDENPIWRLCVRDRTDGKLLRVRAIDRNVLELPVWDLTTADHKVYLPEADVTISQCDDFTIVLGSMLQSVGYPVRCRVIRTSDSDDWNHIYLMVGLPPRAPSRWVSLDASVDKPPGWEAPRSMVADMRDFNVP